MTYTTVVYSRFPLLGCEKKKKALFSLQIFQVLFRNIQTIKKPNITELCILGRFFILFFFATSGGKSANCNSRPLQPFLPKNMQLSINKPNGNVSDGVHLVHKSVLESVLFVQL